MTEIATTNSKFIKPSELAKILEVSASTVCRWVHDGDIPGVKIGGKTIRIMRRDVEVLLKRVNGN
jgi:excisionase family DNA binding protein